jgi:hypothetical protein
MHAAEREEQRSARGGLVLPPTFDAQRDVLVWLGEPTPELPSGARVFRIGNAGAVPADRGERLVRDAAELFQVVLALAGAAPRHALVHRTATASPEEARQLARVLADALRARAMQQKTLQDAGPTWLLQGLANLPALAAHPTIAPLRGAFAGRPCVLVSPGPSLTRNVNALRELAERALIVSGTHALSALARAAVAPHLVVCADPGDLARHWAGLDLARIEGFVIGATCSASTFAAPAQRRFVFASNGALDAWLFDALGEVPGLATGGSVACSMHSLALHLGCDPIVFVGQDLSFGERFYAEGGLDGDATVAAAGPGEFVLMKPAGADGIGTRLADGRLQFTVPQRIFEVPGWAGGTVRTTPQLKAFLDWFEHVAPMLRGATRVLNCTEGGAHIAGMEHLPLAEASADWAPLAPVAALLERAHAVDATARRGALRAWVRRTSAALEACVTSARRCAHLAARSRPDAEGLQRAERELAGALRAAPLVSLVAQGDIAAARERARAATDLGANLDAARALYGVVERAGALLMDPLRAAERALE